MSHQKNFFPNRRRLLQKSKPGQNRECECHGARHNWYINSTTDAHNRSENTAEEGKTVRLRESEHLSPYSLFCTWQRHCTHETWQYGRLNMVCIIRHANKNRKEILKCPNPRWKTTGNQWLLRENRSSKRSSW